MSSTEISLVKGDRVDLTKSNPGLKTVHIGLGWDVNASGGAAFDLDAFGFVLNANGKLNSGKNSIIYFNNKVGEGLEHMGDNLTGVGDGDDETIKARLDQVPGDSLLIGVNIYQALERKQNFGQVNNAFIRIYDADTNQELLKYDLSEDYSKFNAVLFGKLYKKDGEWKFQATGEGTNGDIAQLAQSYLA